MKICEIAVVKSTQWLLVAKHCFGEGLWLWLYKASGPIVNNFINSMPQSYAKLGLGSWVWYLPAHFLNLNSSLELKGSFNWLIQFNCSELALKIFLQFLYICSCEVWNRFWHIYPGFHVLFQCLYYFSKSLLLPFFGFAFFFFLIGWMLPSETNICSETSQRPF